MQAVPFLNVQVQIQKNESETKPCLMIFNRRNDVVVSIRASASQSVDLGFISLVESYQKTF